MNVSTAIASSAPYRAVVIITARTLDVIERVPMLARALARHALTALLWLPWLILCAGVTIAVTR